MRDGLMINDRNLEIHTLKCHDFACIYSVVTKGVATQDRVFPHYVPNSSIKHSKSDSKDRSQEIL
jgi:hypothetical protein